MHLFFAAFKGAMSPMVHARVNENKLVKALTHTGVLLAELHERSPITK